MPVIDSLVLSGRMRSNGLGLQVAGTGFKRNGRDFSGIGINHYALALNELVDMGVGGIGGYEADIRTIKQTWGLPFIRCAFGWYSVSTWYNKYYLDKPGYFAAMDNVVAKCEQYGIGLMPVLFWSLRGFCEMSYNVYGVYSPPSDLSKKTSNSWLLAATYITEVITRYKGSSAIYAWGLGNEIPSSCGPDYFSTWAIDGTKAAWLNWGTRPGGGSYLSTDKMTMSDWRIFTQNCHELINSLDGGGRFISSGTAIGDTFAVNAQTADTFAADSLTQWNNAANGLPWVIYRDQNFNVVTNHVYPMTQGNGLFFSDGTKTHGELIALTKGWADAAGKPCFIEEFGATYHGDSVDQISTNLATETANFQSAVDAITSNNIKLSAAWNYGGNFAGGSAWQKWKMSDPVKQYQLTAIAEANAAMNN